MIGKLWNKLVGQVIIRKVIGKFLKHGVTALAAYLGSKPVMDQLGISIDWTTFEGGALVILTGLGGAAWNFLEHRFFKKPAAAPAPANP